MAISRCNALPQITGDAANCIQYKGYKRTHDGDPPCELTSHNVKWVKRHHTKQCADDPCTWGLQVVYMKADGEMKEVHKTPCYFDDRSVFTHARVHPHVRGQCSRRCTVPPHLASQWQFARSDPEDPDKYYDAIQMLQAELQDIYDREHHPATDSMGSSSSAWSAAAPGAAPEAVPEAAPEAVPGAAPEAPPLPPPRPPPAAASTTNVARKRQVSLADSFMRSGV